MAQRPEARSASVEEEEGAPSSPTLEELLARHGHREPPASLFPALRLAVHAHAQRLGDDVADREQLNRSTTLWALLATNPDVALAAAEGDLDADKLKTALRITVDTGTVIDLPTPVRLDDLLAKALDEHLSTTGSDPLDPLTVTTAVLQSCRRPGGLLPQRLDTMKVDRDAALDALAARRAGRPAGFSRTVRQARDMLGPETQVSASEVIRALNRLHPSSQMQAVSLETTGTTVATDSWLIRVYDVYDADQVLRSKRGIIDLELVLRGLVELEPALAAQVQGDMDTMRWIEGIRPSPAAERHTEPSADVPAQTDLLGREALAKTLLRQLELIGQRGENSILVHLDGSWGSGKSSLFVFLQRAIAEVEGPGASAGQRRSRNRPRYLVVEVNAWREQRLGAQWWTLYRALRVAHLSAAGSWRRRLASRLGHLWDVMTVRRDKLWPVVLSLLVLVVGSIFVARLGLDSDLGIPEVLSIAAVITTGLTAAYRFLVPVSPKSARAMVENSTNPMAEVRDLFARSVQRAGPRRVIFLIDDLDRCEPDYVIRFLEVVQTLVRDAPCEVRKRRGTEVKALGPYAIVAADGLWLRSSYQKAYGDLVHDDLPGKPLGYRFLEKIFQMHIRLPNVEPASKQRYYESLLFPGGQGTSHAIEHDNELQQMVAAEISSVRTTGDLSALNHSIGKVADAATRQSLRSSALEQAATPAAVQRQLHELLPFAYLLDSNPRTIRLFVNAVSMQAYLRFLEGASFELSGLALWAVLEARWPALADHLREHPDDVLLKDSKGETPKNLSEDLFVLLTSPEVASVLDSPRWDVFTPDRVRACTGGDGGIGMNSAQS